MYIYHLTPGPMDMGPMANVFLSYKEIMHWGGGVSIPCSRYFYSDISALGSLSVPMRDSTQYSNKASQIIISYQFLPHQFQFLN